MKTTVFLVRHAEAEGNVYRRCHGQYDSLLTPRGYQQLPFLAKRFADVPLAAVYASDLYRARTTAHAVADSQALPVQIHPALREINMGLWEDLPWAELPLREPEKYHQWRHASWDCVLPNGESPAQAGTRVLEEIQALVKQHQGQTFAVFSHGTAIRSVLALITGLVGEKSAEIGWGDNTCAAKLEWDEQNICTPVYWNDASHLPEELSTFRAIGWTDHKAVPVSPQIWFQSVNLQDPAHRQALLAFARQKFKSAYGSCQKLDETEYLSATAAMLAASPQAVTFGMLDDGCTIAALVRLNVCDTSQPQVGMVGSFVIAPEYQGMGLSGQIVGQAISFYRAQGKAYLCAYVAAENERAKSFYEKFHFIRDGQLENAYGLHYIMKKPIAIPPIE